MRISASCACAAIVFLLSPAHATKVTAKITVSKEYIDALDAAESSRSAGNKDCYWKLPNSIIPVASPSVEFGNDAAAVLFKDDGEAAKPNEIETVKVHAGQLEKKVVVTKPGSTIKFLNVSPFNQELYSPELSAMKPEIQSTNSFRAIEFPVEGVFQIRSKRYPHFLAYVVVTQGTEIALKPDDTYTDELEPGKYTLKIFHDGKWVHKQSFAVEGGRMDPLSVKLMPGQGETGGAEKPTSDDGKDAAAAAETKESKAEAATPKPEKNGN